MSESQSSRDFRIAIIGAGPGGLCMAIKLKQAGFHDFVILEKGEGVGGTWLHNTYPGCACDLPSHLYSYSFEQRPDWPRPYSPQPEIKKYVEHCAEKYELLPHCRFGTGVQGAVWMEDTAQWKLTLESGENVDAHAVVSAVGMFNELSYPEIKGLETYEGKSFHTARWDWDHDLTGRTVGVIGSAASAVQIVPEIVKEAGQVYLFQRTANWVMPKEDDPFTDEMLAAFRSDPNIVAAVRAEIYQGVDEGMTFEDTTRLQEMTDACLEQIKVIKDPELQKKLTPTHPFGCKRPLLSNVFYEAFNRRNLELVTDAIDRITPTGVATTDGKLREMDTMVLATGFEATRYLSTLEVVGRGGQKIGDAWEDGAQAYLGVTTAGFPNLFMLYGPNTNNGSIITMIEHQVDHAVLQIQRLMDEDLAWLDVRSENQATFNEEVQEAIKGIDVWQADCNGYYKSKSGRIVTQWPFSMSDFAARAGQLHKEAFETAPLKDD